MEIEEENVIECKCSSNHRNPNNECFCNPGFTEMFPPSIYCKCDSGFYK